MGQEQREHERHSVFGGNAEITDVFGRGRAPKDRARIVNWSRGGLMLKVPSPRRKMMFIKQDPVLFESDAIECVLRLAPSYKSISVRGEVTHVAPVKKEPDQLLVGISFDAEGTRSQDLAELVTILEPRSRSGRLRTVSASQERVSSRLGKVGSESGREARKSGRQVRASGREARKSGRQASASRRVGQKSARISIDD